MLRTMHRFVSGYDAIAARGLGRGFGVLVILLTCASPVVAQVHKCDEPEQTVATKGSKVGWCHDLKDADGFTVAPNEVSFRLTINGAVTDLGPRTPLGNPSASGLYYFEVALPSAPRGLYPVSVVAYNAEGTSPASNVVTWQVGGPPNKPIRPRIVRMFDWMTRQISASLR